MIGFPTFTRRKGPNYFARRSVFPFYSYSRGEHRHHNLAIICRPPPLIVLVTF